MTDNIYWTTGLAWYDNLSLFRLKMKTIARMKSASWWQWQSLVTSRESEVSSRRNIQNCIEDIETDCLWHIPNPKQWSCSNKIRCESKKVYIGVINVVCVKKLKKILCLVFSGSVSHSLSFKSSEFPLDLSHPFKQDILAAKAQLNMCTCALSVRLSVRELEYWNSLTLYPFTCVYMHLHAFTAAVAMEPYLWVWIHQKDWYIQDIFIQTKYFSTLFPR